MVSVFSGSGLGLFNSSLTQLGGQGEAGQAAIGGQRDRIYVNAATGNLVVQVRDEFLKASGLDATLLRTYNSLGLLDDDNGDNWRVGPVSYLTGFSSAQWGQSNTQLTRVAQDGSTTVYHYVDGSYDGMDMASAIYRSTDGSGAHDEVRLITTVNESTGQEKTWLVWAEGSSGVEEYYDATSLQLTKRYDKDGNKTDYRYTDGLLTQVDDASLGQFVDLIYNGNQLVELRTVDTSTTTTAVQSLRYAYDSQNRLSRVIIDLTPEDNDISDGKRDADGNYQTTNGSIYVTNYTYDGDSNRIASIVEGNGVSISFTYDPQGRVRTHTDGEGNTTSFDYTDTVSPSVTATANSDALETSTQSIVTQTPYNLDSSPLSTTETQTVTTTYPLNNSQLTSTETQTSFVDYSLIGDGVVTHEYIATNQTFALDTSQIKTTERTSVSYDLNTAVLETQYDEYTFGNTVSGIYKIHKDDGSIDIVINARSSGMTGTYYYRTAGSNEPYTELPITEFYEDHSYYQNYVWGVQIPYADIPETPQYIEFKVEYRDADGNVVRSTERYDSRSLLLLRSVPSTYPGVFGQVRWVDHITTYPFYEVQEGDTWETIANTLYGSPGVANALSAYLGHPTLTPGVRLFGREYSNVSPVWPSVLTDTNVQVPSEPYYELPYTQIWSEISQALYGTTYLSSELSSLFPDFGRQRYAHLYNPPATLTDTTPQRTQVPPYYPVASGDTWESIANSLYGTTTLADELSQAMGSPALVAGLKLTDIPDLLTDTVTTTIDVTPYYQVQAGDTWASIANALYGSADVSDELQAHMAALGVTSLTVGQQLTGFASDLANVSTVTVSVPAYYTVKAGETWQSISSLLYGTTAVANELQTYFSEQGITALNSGVKLTGFPSPLNDVQTNTVTTTYYLVKPSDTWVSIAAAVYGDADAASALQNALGDSSLTPGDHLLVPGTLTFTTSTGGHVDLTDALDHVTTYVYDAQDRLNKTISPTAITGVRQETIYGYDSDDNLLSVTDGAGNSVAYRYDVNGNRVFDQDSEGNTVTRTYSASNQLLSETVYATPDPDGLDPANTISAMGPNNAQTIYYVYDAEDHVRFVIDAEGQVTEHRYDGRGARIQTWHYAGGRFDLSGYDVATPPDESTLESWAAIQDYTQTSMVRYSYDFRGQLSGESRYDSIKASGSPSYSNFSRTAYVYDPQGRLLSRIDPRANSVSAMGAFTTHYTYDRLGRLLSSTDSAGNTTLNQYADESRQTLTRLANGLLQVRVHDRTGALVQQYELSPETPAALWSQDFSQGAAGLKGNGLNDPSYMRLENGRLVLQTQDAAVATWPSLFGERTYAFEAGISFHAEVTTGDSSAGRYLLIGATNTGNIAANTYRRHAAYFVGGNINASYWDPTAQAWKTVRLGAAKDDTTYEVEVETHAGGTTLYVYEQGQSRKDGFSHSLSDTDWGVIRSRLWTRGAAGQATATMYVDNLSETQTPAINTAPDTPVARWSQDFIQGASGLKGNGLNDPSYMQVVDGRLVLQTQDVAKTTWPSLIGQRTYAFEPGICFRAEVTTGASSAGRYLLIGATNTGSTAANTYRRHAAYFVGGNINASYWDSTAQAWRSVRLGAAKDNTTYVVEVETHAGGTTLYVYEQGLIRELGLTHTLTDSDWGNVRSQLWTRGASGQTTATMYVDNLSETQIPAINTLPEVSTDLWLQNFSDGVSGFTGNGLNDPNYMRVEDGRLVLQTQDVATTTYPSLAGQRTYAFDAGVRFRAEVTTGANSAGRYLLIGATNTGSVAANTYRRHAAYFSGGNIYAHYWDPTAQAWRSVRLGAAKDDTTYFVELATHGAGTTLYVYEQGQSCAEGFSHSLSDTDWGVVRSRLWTLGKSGRATAIMYVDNLSESLSQRSEHLYAYDAAGRLRMVTDPNGVRTYTLYDEVGRQIGVIDARGYLRESVYNAAGQVVKTLSDASALSASQLASLVDANGEPADVAIASLRPSVDSAADRVSWTLYDKAGRAVYAIDEKRNISQQFYDGAGRVTDRIEYDLALSTAALASLGASSSAADLEPLIRTSGNDRHSRRFYGANGALIGQLDAEGYLTESRYDAAGRLIETVAYAVQLASASNLHASGGLDAIRQRIVNDDKAAHNGVAGSEDIHSYRFYNAKSELIGELDGEGYLTEYAYDTGGNRTQQIQYALPQSYSAGMDLEQLRVDAMDPNTRTTTWTYTLLDQVETVTDPQGVVTRYEYDEMGNRVRTTTELVGGAQSRTLTTRYDAFGRVTGELSGEGSAALGAMANPSQAEIEQLWQDYGLSHVYDLSGHRVSTTDANGHTTLFFYNGTGQLTHSVNALGEVSERVYNGFGQVIRCIEHAQRLDINGAGLVGGLLSDVVRTLLINNRSSLDRETETAYDLRGAISQILDPGAGHEQSFTFNAFGELIEHRQKQELSSTSAVDFTVELYTFDKRGFRTYVEQQGLKDNLYRIKSSEYDAFGRVIAETDYNGNTTTTAYDKRGQVVTTTAADESRRQQSYDAFGRIRTQTDALGQVTTYAYDDVERSVTITTPEGISTTTVRTAQGQVQRVTDGEGQSTSYHYDLDGNLIEVTDPLGQRGSQDFDAAGLQLSRTDANGTVTRFHYDAANRLMTRQVDPTGVNLTTTYTYNAFGDTYEQTDANGTVTRTLYDEAGQVSEVIVDPRDSVSNPNGLHLITRYTYDGLGNTLTVIEGAETARALITEYRYDSLGRRTMEIKDPDGLNLITRYRYDDNDNVIETIDAGNNVTYHVYDETNRQVYTIAPTGAVSETRYDSNGLVIARIQYARTITIDQLTSIPTKAGIDEQLVAISDVGLDRIVRYAYDADSRLRFEVDALGYVKEYVRNNNGQVIETIRYATAVAWPQQSNASAADEVAAQLVISAEDRRTWTIYDAAGRVIYRVDGQGYVSKSKYDAISNVIEKTKYSQAIDTRNILAPLTAEDLESQLVGLRNVNQDQTTRYVYEADTRLRYEVDAQGYVTEYLRDGNGQTGKTIHYSESIQWQPVAGGDALADVAALLRLNPDDQVTLTLYDAAGRSTYSINAMGYVTKASYDSVGNVVELTEYSQAIDVNTLPYNSPAEEIRPQLGTLVESNSDRTRRYAYDTDSRVIYEIDSLGFVTEYVYVGNNQVSEKIQYVSAINLASLSGGFSRDTIAGLVAVDANDRHSWTVHDSLGRETYSIDTLGHVSEVQYDAVGNVVKSTLYANPVQIFGADELIMSDWLPPASSADQSTRFTYDISNRLIEKQTPNGVFETYAYDAFDNLVTVNQAPEIPTTIDTGWQAVEVLESNQVYENFDIAWVTQYDAVAVYTDSSVNGAGDLYIQSFNKNLGWGTKTLLDSNVSDVQLGSMYTEPNQVISWSKVIDATTTEIVVAELQSNGSWNKLTLASGNITEYEFEGDTWGRQGIVWLEENGGQFNVKSKFKHRYSGDWDAEQSVISTAARPLSLQFKVAYGNVSVAWHENNAAYVRRYSTSTKSWGVPENVTSGLVGNVEDLSLFINEDTGVTFIAFSLFRPGSQGNGNYTGYIWESDAAIQLTQFESGTDASLNIQIVQPSRGSDDMFLMWEQAQGSVKDVVIARLTATSDIASNEFTVETLASDISRAVSYQLSVDDEEWKVSNTGADDRDAVFSMNEGGVVTYRTYVAGYGWGSAETINLLELSPNESMTASLTVARYKNMLLVGMSSLGKVSTVSYEYNGYAGGRYFVQSGDTWGSIAENTYGTIAVSPQLREHYNDIPLTSGLLLDNLPERLESDPQRILQTVYDANGRPVFSVGADGAIIENTYNEQGKVVVERRYSQVVSDWQAFGSAVDRSQYLRSLRNVSDHIIYNGYDRLGRLEYTLDGAGSLTRFSYDAFGNLTKERHYADLVSELDATLLSKSLDKSALLNSYESSKDQVTHYVNDKLGRQAVVVSSGGLVTENTFDAFGNKVELRAHSKELTPQDIDTLIMSSNVDMYLDGMKSLSDKRVRNHFDSESRLLYQVVMSDGQNNTAVVKNNTYDAFGNVIETVHYADTIDFSQAAQQDQLETQIAAYNDNPDNRISRLAYDNGDQLRFSLKMTDGGHASIAEKRYDAFGNNIEIIEYDTRETILLNDLPTVAELEADISSSYDAQIDRKTIKTFDLANNLSTLTDAENNSERYEYDAFGNLTLFENKLGYVTTFEYDGKNNIVNEYRPISHWTSVVNHYDYDVFGNMIAVTEGYGSDEARVTEYEYDKANRQVATIHPDAGVYDEETSKVIDSGIRRRVDVVYDAFGNAVITRDSASTAYAYAVFDNANRIRYQVDRNGYVTGFDYNAFDEQISITRYAVNLFGSTLPSATQYSLHEMEQLVTKSQEDREIWVEYDQLGRKTNTKLTAVDIYDSARDTITVGIQPETRLTYNAFGDVVHESQRINLYDWADTYHYYNILGQCIGTVDSGNFLTQWQYDAFGNKQSQVEYSTPISSAVNESAMPSPPLTQESIWGRDREERWVYDGMNRVTEHHWVNAAWATAEMTAGSVSEQSGTLVEYFVYDEAGNQTEHTDTKGAATTYTYDRQNRLLKTISPEYEIAVHFQTGRYYYPYNTRRALGNSETTEEYDLVSGVRNSREYTYDLAGNLIREAKTNFESYANWSDHNYSYLVDTRYEYDNEGQRTATVKMREDGTSFRQTAEYNAFGEVDLDSNPGYDRFVVYDNGGRVTYDTGEDGVARRYYYDLIGNLTQEIRLGDLATSADDRVTTFRYNSSNQLETIVKPTFTIDRTGDVYTPTEHKTYDRWGNVLTLGVSETDGGVYQSAEFKYNHNNQVTLERQLQVTVYDESGVGSSVRPETKYFYNQVGYLVGITDAESHTKTFGYDAADNQIWERDASGILVQYAYDTNGNITERIDSTGSIRTYWYSGDRIAKEGILYVANDPLLLEKTLRTYDYDANGVTTVTENDSFVYNIASYKYIQNTAYDEFGNIIATKGKDGYEKTYDYDDFGQKIYEYDGLNAQTWAYDKYGRLENHVDLGGLEHRYYYNGHGELEIEEIWRDGVRLDDVRSYQYYENGLVKSITDTGEAGLSELAQKYSQFLSQGYQSNSRSNSSSYEYDALGNKTRETHSSQFYVTTDVATYTAADATRTVNTTYNNLGYIAHVDTSQSDQKVMLGGVVYSEQSSRIESLDYWYDAVGNRRRIQVATQDRNSTERSTQDLWFTYDEANRLAINEGELVNGQITLASERGSLYWYDNNGRRSYAVFKQADGSYLKEKYGYSRQLVGGSFTARDYGLESVANISTYRSTSYFPTSSGTLEKREVRELTLTGKTEREFTYERGSTNQLYMKSVSNYWYDNQTGVQRDYILTTFDEAGNEIETIEYDYGYLDSIPDSYDEAGNLRHYRLKYWSQESGGGATQDYYQDYNLYDSYSLATTRVEQIQFTPAETKQIYDLRGNLHYVYANGDEPFHRAFISSRDGQTLTRFDRSNGKNTGQDYYYSDGKVLGETGDINGTEFGILNPADSGVNRLSAPTMYRVETGDTLRSIALKVFGDASLWYIIADANGITSDEELTPNRELRIPNVVSGSKLNNFETFKPYNPSDIIGDTSPKPEPPPPPKKKSNKCGGFAMFIVVIVAIVVTVYTAGLALSAMAPASAAAGTAGGAAASAAAGGAWSAGTAALAGSTAAGVSLGGYGIAAAAIGSAVGSIASQLVGMGLGIQDKFSWGAVASSALTGGLTAGGGVAGVSSSVATATGLNQAVVQGALNSVANQGINILTGQQEKFNWNAVAAAAIAAPISQSVGASVGGTVGKATSDMWGDFTQRFVSGSIQQGVQLMVSGSGKMQWSNIVTDAFGNAVANSIVGSMASYNDAPSEPTEPSVGAMENSAAGSRDESAVVVSRDETAGAVSREESIETITVKPGDTLSDLVGRYDEDYLNRLAIANGLDSPHDIQAGQTITMYSPEDLDGIDVPADYSQRTAEKRDQLNAQAAAEQTAKAQVVAGAVASSENADISVAGMNSTKGYRASRGYGDPYWRDEKGRFERAPYRYDPIAERGGPEFEGSAYLNAKLAKYGESSYSKDLYGDGDLLTFNASSSGALEVGWDSSDMSGTFKASLGANAEMQYANQDVKTEYVDAKLQVRSGAGLKGEVGASISKKGVSIEAGVDAELVALQAHGEIDTKEYDILGVKFKLHGEGDLNALALGGSLGGKVKVDTGGKISLKAYAGASALFGGKIKLGLEIDASQAISNLASKPEELWRRYGW